MTRSVDLDTFDRRTRTYVCRTCWHKFNMRGFETPEKRHGYACTRPDLMDVTAAENERRERFQEQKEKLF